jgi:hypothetical protein
VFVEGGGSSRGQQAQIREGFCKLFTKVLGAQPKPKVIACGGRDEAFKDWKRALKSNPDTRCLLLVDSEDPVVSPDVDPWAHVRMRKDDGWEKPAGTTDEQLHFMVQAMESWLIADPEALEAYYRQGFHKDRLPARKDVEAIPKLQLYDALERATKDTKTKGRYQKSHGFVLISLIDPTKVAAAAPYAARFFDHLVASSAALAQSRS